MRILAVLLLMTSLASAQLVSSKYVPVYSNGVLTQLTRVERAVADMPLLEGELPGDAVIPAGPVSDLVIENGAVRLKTAEERIAEVATRQAAKPPLLKVRENEYFELCRAACAVVQDPRALDPVPPKLSFEELFAMAELIPAEQAALKLDLNLQFLTIDAALKTLYTIYEIPGAWWVDAAYHPEIVAP